MTRLVTMAAVVAMMLGGAVEAQTAAFGPQNPFYAASTLPYQAPDFTKIHDADFEPAIDAGIAQQMAELDAIASSKKPATFANTLVALEKSGQLLTRVTLVFDALAQANTNDALAKVQEIEAPRRAALNDAIYLNGRLFARVKTVYAARKSLGLNAESMRLVEYQYGQFVKAGANLSDADKAKLKALNQEEATRSCASRDTVARVSLASFRGLTEGK